MKLFTLIFCVLYLNIRAQTTEEIICYLQDSTLYSYYTTTEIWRPDHKAWEPLNNKELHKVTVDRRAKMLNINDTKTGSMTYDIKDCAIRKGAISYICRNREDGDRVEMIFDSDDNYVFMILYDYDINIKLKYSRALK